MVKVNFLLISISITYPGYLSKKVGFVWFIAKAENYRMCKI